MQAATVGNGAAGITTKVDAKKWDRHSIRSCPQHTHQLHPNLGRYCKSSCVMIPVYPKSGPQFSVSKTCYIHERRVKCVKFSNLSSKPIRKITRGILELCNSPTRLTVHQSHQIIRLSILFCIRTLNNASPRGNEHRAASLSKRGKRELDVIFLCLEESDG